MLVKPGALQLKKAWQGVLNAIDVGPLSDQSLVDPHDVLLDRDLKLALLLVLSPGLVERIQEPLVVLTPDPDDNLLIGFIPGASSKVQASKHKFLDSNLLGVHSWWLVA